MRPEDVLDDALYVEIDSDEAVESSDLLLESSGACVPAALCACIGVNYVCLEHGNSVGALSMLRSASFFLPLGSTGASDNG